VQRYSQRSLSLGFWTAIVFAGIAYSDRYRWDCKQRSGSLGVPGGSAAAMIIAGYICVRKPVLQNIRLERRKACAPRESAIHHRSDHLQIGNTWLTQRHTQHACTFDTMMGCNLFQFSIIALEYVDLYFGGAKHVCGMLCTMTVVRGNDGASRHYSGGPMACWQPLSSEATGSRTSSANHMSSAMHMPQRTKCSRQLTCQTRQLCTHPTLA
jgi:hypothetical protein